MAAPGGANPFELGGRGGAAAAAGRGGAAAAARLRTPLTEAEQLEKLNGYVSVPRDLWPFVKYSTHVRYIETEARGGEFRSGGFILNNPFDIKPRGSAVEKRFFKMQNGFAKAARDHAEWIVAYEDVAFLYAKGAAVELTLQRDIQTAATTLAENVQRVADYSKKLEGRITALERRTG